MQRLVLGLVVLGAACALALLARAPDERAGPGERAAAPLLIPAEVAAPASASLPAPERAAVSSSASPLLPRGPAFEETGRAGLRLERARWTAPLDRLGHVRLAPGMRATYARLHHRRVCVDVDGPLWPLLEAIAAALEVPLEVTPEAAPVVQAARVRLQLDDVPAVEVLSWALSRHRALSQWYEPDGALRIFVDTPPTDDEAPTRSLAPVGDHAPERPPAPALPERRLVLRFESARLDDVVRAVQEAHDVPLFLGFDVEHGQLVTLPPAERTIEELLRELLEPRGLGLRFQHEHGSFLIATRRTLAELTAAERQEDEAAAAAGPLLERRVGPTPPLPLAALVERIGVAAGARTHLAASSARGELIALPTGCSVEAACERVALAMGGEWGLWRGDADELGWSEADAGLRDALDAALARWRDGPLGEEARAAALRAAALRAADVPLEVEALRAARAGSRAALLDALRAACRAAAAQDAAATRDGDLADADRIAAWAELAAWLEDAARRPAHRSACASRRQPPAPDLTGACPCQLAPFAARVARWLANGALVAADHPWRARR